MSNIVEQLKLVKDASLVLASIDSVVKNDALKAIAEVLDANRTAIISANEKDLNDSTDAGIAEPILKRLKFDDKKIDDVIDGIMSLISLKDPVGETLMATELDDGLELYKCSSPIGVVGVIFESRPDALVQIATLCLKSSNGAILKGGSEAKNTNRVLFELIVQATDSVGIPHNWIELIESREDVSKILSYDEYIDLIIPRGSNAFVQYIMNNSKIPVIGHADGICHCYVDADCDVEKALKVVLDAKTQYVSVCNATETLLVHENVAQAFLPKMAELFFDKGCTIKCDEKAYEIVKNSMVHDCDKLLKADESDWSTEYLDLMISIKIVSSLEEAVDHINKYGSGHTDSIMTENDDTARFFMSRVDSGNVFLNCSTRFSDGFRYGFGAEVGVSTSKIHARGPVGLEGLLIYKYKLFGNGHVVDDYAQKRKTFKHNPLDKKDPFSI